MDIIEFHTKVKNGMIEIPAEYREQIKNRTIVRVTVSTEKAPGKRKNLIDRLLKKPLRIRNFHQMKRDDIYD